MQCRLEFRQARYEGIFTPPVVGQQSLIFPGHHGGLNWGGVMVDLKRGLLIINNQRLPYMQGLVPREELDAINAKSFQESPGNAQGFRVQAGLPYGAIKDPWMSSLTSLALRHPGALLPVSTCALAMSSGAARSAQAMTVDLGDRLPDALRNRYTE